MEDVVRRKRRANEFDGEKLITNYVFQRYSLEFRSKVTHTYAKEHKRKEKDSYLKYMYIS